VLDFPPRGHSRLRGRGRAGRRNASRADAMSARPVSSWSVTRPWRLTWRYQFPASITVSETRGSWRRWTKRDRSASRFRRIRPPSQRYHVATVTGIPSARTVPMTAGFGCCRNSTTSGSQPGIRRHSFLQPPIDVALMSAEPSPSVGNLRSASARRTSRTAASASSDEANSAHRLGTRAGQPDRASKQLRQPIVERSELRGHGPRGRQQIVAVARSRRRGQQVGPGHAPAQGRDEGSETALARDASAGRAPSGIRGEDSGVETATRGVTRSTAGGSPTMDRSGSTNSPRPVTSAMPPRGRTARRTRPTRRLPSSDLAAA